MEVCFHTLKYAGPDAAPSRKLLVEELLLRLLAGFVVVLSSTVLVNKLGDLLYGKGIAKPFYLKGYRLHHRNLLPLVPASYVAVAALVYLHYVRVLWLSFWPSVEVSFGLVALCLVIDFSFDAISNPEKRNALVHHEWVYVLVPAYALTHLVALV